MSEVKTDQQTRKKDVLQDELELKQYEIRKAKLDLDKKLRKIL
jgi:hypothetical protein